MGNRRLFRRILSLILVCSLSVSLLSGCGKESQTVNDKGQDNAKTAVSDENLTAVKNEQDELAGISENIRQTAEKLLLDDADDNNTIDALEEQMSAMDEASRKWLDAQKEVTSQMSEETRSILSERNAEFADKLAKEKEKAESLLADIRKAYASGNSKTAEEKEKELKALLVGEDKIYTYGESLPNEVEINEPSEEELSEEDGGEEAVNIDAGVTESSDADKQDDTALKELTALTGDTILSDEAKETAKDLGTALDVYNYLKNNLNYEYYYGSRKGAEGTFEAMGGNDMDQASLLIAMLRYLGYEAEYVKGTIRLTPEQVINLTGSDTAGHGADVLAAAGTPVTKLTRDGEIVYVDMEHLWVRANIPYSDYRGAGDSSGDKVWLDLDTGIKAYEDVNSIYDEAEKQGITDEMKSLADGGDISSIEDTLEDWAEQIASSDEDVYARKRIIQQEELTYLPASLQYIVESETEVFAQVDGKYKDTVTFTVGEEMLASCPASDIAGKNILLSFHPATSSDEEILNAYGSVFNAPAHSVYMKPVLLVDGEVVSEGEEVYSTTLGTKQNFRMVLHSGNSDTTVDNDVTTGSMYAVTLDNQNITPTELQNIYDETAVLKDSVSEDNVYSEEYLGKLLSLAGKLYFAQVDITDIMAAEIYNVSSVRSLSEGITGYEVKTNNTYGLVTKLSCGSLYIDVDTDSHSVLSLNGEEDAPREYMMSMGMIGSSYEDIVWQQLTGEESISTISILKRAKESNIDILVVSSFNIPEEIVNIDLGENVKKEIVNAVDNNKIVIVPKHNITINDWNGTGYIILNPKTNAAEYKISGGINGGSVPKTIDEAYLMGMFAGEVIMMSSLESMIGAAKLLSIGGIMGCDYLAAFGLVTIISSVKTVVNMCNMMSTITEMYYDYIMTGDESCGIDMIKTMHDGIVGQCNGDIWDNAWSATFWVGMGWLALHLF